MVHTSLLLMSISSLQCGYLFNLFSVECVVHVCVCVLWVSSSITLPLIFLHRVSHGTPPYFSETGSLDLELTNSA